MGRDTHSNRYTVENCLMLSVYRLKDRIGRHDGVMRIEGIWTDSNTGGKEEVRYPVRLVDTPCNFGGRRWWFTCPICKRRVAKLYLPPGAKYFGCRHCYNLTYQSCRDSHNWDALFSAMAKEFNMSPDQIKQRFNEECSEK